MRSSLSRHLQGSVLAGLLSSLACGGGPATEAVDESTDPIVNGFPDPGHAAVVSLATAPPPLGSWFCSGTLITPSTVLTAGHCLSVSKAPFVCVGESALYPDFCVPPVSSLHHPTQDLGLVFLAWPITNVPTARLPSSAPVPSLGEALTIVGFGMVGANNYAGAGTKRYGFTHVSKVDSATFYDASISGGAATICFGDSGGPALAASNCQVGVNDFTNLPYCVEGGYVRVDVNEAWIRANARGPLSFGTPTTCEAAGASCGTIPDGCGGTLNCGSCAGSYTCGGGGIPNQCGRGGCTPQNTCSIQGYECGIAPDGCGGEVQCGTCGSGCSCQSHACIGTCAH